MNRKKLDPKAVASQLGKISKSVDDLKESLKMKEDKTKFDSQLKFDGFWYAGTGYRKYRN